jgi:transcription antitermination factor NusG
VVKFIFAEKQLDYGVVFMSLRWYALRSKTRKEDVVFRQIYDRDIEIFYPRLRVNPVNPRSRRYKPYFPGYVFVKLNLEETGMSVFQWMPHTLGLVSFGGEPAIVPENLIHEIRQRVESIDASGGEVFEGLKPGDSIQIQNGPFQGYEAIFDTRIPGSERVRVLLQLLDSRNVPLELSASSIQQKKKK